MFVKLYRYKIKSKDFPKWKKIINIAGKIYRKHGKNKWTLLTKKEKGLITIIELGYYKSKNAFIAIKNKVDNDEAINSLFNEFLDVVHEKKIIEDEFKAI